MSIRDEAEKKIQENLARTCTLHIVFVGGEERTFKCNLGEAYKTSRDFTTGASMTTPYKIGENRLMLRPSTILMMRYVMDDEAAKEKTDA